MYLFVGEFELNLHPLFLFFEAEKSPGNLFNKRDPTVEIAKIVMRKARTTVLGTWMREPINFFDCEIKFFFMFDLLVF